MKKIMKTVWSSYLHLSNILLSRIEFSSRVVESSFSTRLDLSSSTSQLDLTLFQKNFNLTQHFSSQVLNLYSSTQLNAISLITCYICNWKNHYFIDCKDEKIKNKSKKSDANQVFIDSMLHISHLKISRKDKLLMNASNYRGKNKKFSL